MFINNWKKEVFTIPNLLSIFRLILIPVYITIYRREAYLLAGCILAVSCLTDLADGMIARKYNMVSSLGKFLDPLADKLTQFSLLICLAGSHPSLKFVVLLLFIKEMFQVIAALVNLRQGRVLPGALMAGKVCTTVLFASMILIVLLPHLHESTVNAIAAIDTAFLFYAFGRYVTVFCDIDTSQETC